jgi:hypothetical protein
MLVPLIAALMNDREWSEEYVGDWMEVLQKSQRYLWFKLCDTNTATTSAADMVMAKLVLKRYTWMGVFDVTRALSAMEFVRWMRGGM